MSLSTFCRLSLATVLAICLGSVAVAEEREAVIDIHGVPFFSWAEYTQSDLFRAMGGRCATADRITRQFMFPETEGIASSDCSSRSRADSPSRRSDSISSGSWLLSPRSTCSSWSGSMVP